MMYFQVGVNTTATCTASVLDINSSNDGLNFEGFMPPKVNLSERNSIPVTAADNRLMVFLKEGTNRCI
jgi:hypothetical protein